MMAVGGEMPIHNFGIGQKITDVDKVSDRRTETEKQFTDLSLYNHEKADIALIERWAEELINVSGAFMRIFIKNQNPNADASVFDDNSDVTYSNPVLLKGYTQPVASKPELTKWGLDTELKTTITFPRHIIFKEFGDRGIRAGDLIEFPQNAMGLAVVRYRVLNGYDFANFNFRWIYWQVEVENFSGDVTVVGDDRGRSPFDI